MGTIAEFVESLDITSEKKDDLRQHLQNLQVILSDNCQAAVLRVLLKAKGWPASFLLYDEAKAYGALKNIGLPADARELVADVNILRRQQLKLELLVLDGTQDTLMDQKLGKIYYQSAAECLEMSGLPAPDIPKLEAGCQNLIEQWQQTSNLAKAVRTGTRQSPRSTPPQQVRLTDLVPEHHPSKAADMQPLVMQMLRAVSEAVGSPQHLVDTHSSNYLKRPTRMINCCGLASTLVEWTQLVMPWEFELRSDQVVSLLGRLIERCKALFRSQPRRQHVFAVGIMLDAVEVYAISRKDGKFMVERTDLQPLSIDSDSPGLRLVASVLQASFEQLGYCSTPLDPASFQIHGFAISDAQLIQESSAPRSEHPGSYVFRVAVDRWGPAILKLSQTCYEEMFLIRLDGPEHVVRVLVAGVLEYDDTPWHAMLLQPYGRLLEHSDAPSLMARVASDVAQAISDCASRGIAHQDVTAGNLVEYQGRGYLCDFNAAKFVEDWSQLPSPTSFVGTPIFAACSVLEGGPHTESSMYEGLFYSLLYICRGGHLPDAWAFKITGSAKKWAMVRRGCMMREPPIATWDVPEGVAPFIRALHALFWPQTHDGFFKYRMDVTAKEVQDVYTQFVA